MALFTRLREKVAGSGLKFDNIDNIARKEDEANVDTENDHNFVARHSSKSNVSVFTKESQFKSFTEQDLNKYSKTNDKFVNVMPPSGGNNENAAPFVSNRIQETGPGLSKKLSFHTLNSQMQNLDAVQPQLSPRFDGLGPDNRFATSRSVSFRGAPSTAAAVPSIPVPSANSESKDESFEDVHSYSDDDIEEHELSKQDRIEMVFSKARHNHIDEVIMAIQNGFNVNTKDANGNTIMHICAQNNRKKLGALLLQKFPQCNIRAENFKNLTPLDYAERYGFTSMITWLKEVNAQNETQAARNVSKFR